MEKEFTWQFTTLFITVSVALVLMARDLSAYARKSFGDLGECVFHPEVEHRFR